MSDVVLEAYVFGAEAQALGDALATAYPALALRGVAFDRAELGVPVVEHDALQQRVDADLFANLQARNRKATAFWDQQLPPTALEEDPRSEVSFLEADHEAGRAGTLVYRRESSAGGMLVVIPTVHIDLSNGEPAISTLSTYRSTAPAPANLDMWSIAGEAAEIATLIGFFMGPTPAGIGLTLSSQVLGFIFREVAVSSRSAQEPNVPRIEEQLAQALDAARVKELLEDVNQLWRTINSDLKMVRDSGYDPEADSGEARAALRALEFGIDEAAPQRRIDVSVAKLKEHGAAGFPGLLWAGSIQLNALQIRVRLLQAQSSSGLGPDADLNRRFHEAIEDLLLTFHHHIDYANAHLGAASEAVRLRLGQVGPIHAGKDQPTPSMGMGPSQTMHLWEVIDAGRPGEPAVLVPWFDGLGCCWPTDANKEPARQDAEARRMNYLTDLRARTEVANGIGGPDRVQHAIESWQRGYDATKQLDEMMRDPTAY